MDATQPGPGDQESLTIRLSEHALGYLHSAALRVAARIGIADHLADGPRTPEELAALTGVSAPHLQRALRLLATREVFREDKDGAFHLTPAAEFLRSDAPTSMRDGVIMLTDETFWKPAGRLEDTVRAGRTVFDEIFGAPFFDHLARVPQAGEAFDTGMAGLSDSEDDVVAAACAFPATGTVVDIGGGRGGLLRRTLLRHPGLTGVLYDQEAVLRHHHLDDPALAGRWEVRPGDFFASVPDGADVYLLKRILHDWSDEDCLRILRACRAAMKDGSRLLVIDAVIVRDNAPDLGKTLDVLMMTSLNGRERGEQEFRRLLAEAGLRLTRVLPTPSAMSIVEATAV
ncbi:methyltransferase [Streptomyces syringium]|uniref:methyltransferase n=1 Tax=Streptomyces syringium TaxID=76729 RepID=UPI00365B1847